MASATFLELRQRLAQGTFDFLDDASTGTVKLKRWINEAYLEVCSEERWPFLQATTTGPPPLTVTDLGNIEDVVDTGSRRALQPADPRNLTDVYTDLTTTGTPQWWYVDAATTIKTYPVGGALSVRYWRVPVPMVADGDTPIIPERYQDLIILGAARRGFIDTSDYWNIANARDEFTARLDTMRRDLLWQDNQEGHSVLDVTGELADTQAWRN